MMSLIFSKLGCDKPPYLVTLDNLVLVNARLFFPSSLQYYYIFFAVMKLPRDWVQRTVSKPL